VSESVPVFVKRCHPSHVVPKVCDQFLAGLLSKFAARPNQVGGIYWGPFLGWGYMMDVPMETRQWGFLAPVMKDFDDMQMIGNDGIQAISATLETMGIFVRPRFACCPQLSASLVWRVPKSLSLSHPHLVSAGPC